MFSTVQLSIIHHWSRLWLDMNNWWFNLVTHRYVTQWVNTKRSLYAIQSTHQNMTAQLTLCSHAFTKTMIIYFVSAVENEYDARRYLLEDLQEPYLCLPLQIEVFVWMLQTFDLRKIHEQVAAATYDNVLVTPQKKSSWLRYCKKRDTIPTYSPH